ncbi:hypothetical protein FA95DRAFT_1554975 [Auriscalpium vulgare]|uniref:Uncharacterized protein n=1 Tax=Auriscalpium vulgare TaxID=40419 RepID=A0ACB8S5Y0_9AGAM|nr:hypothetical protein FA95DRAFT_1554975 [Auriscalpium vulgare]
MQRTIRMRLFHLLASAQNLVRNPPTRFLSAGVPALPTPAPSPTMFLQWPFDLVDGDIPDANRGAFWDLEGDTLLIAGVHAFQVQKADLVPKSRVLAQSVVAADNFADHQGRRVVRLDSSGEAVDMLLRWIYSPDSVRQQEGNDITSLCRFINLTSTYQPKGARIMALQYMNPYYKQRRLSYAAWDALTPISIPRDGVVAVNAARNLAAFSLLPVALLDASLVATDKNLSGLSNAMDRDACTMLRKRHGSLAREIAMLLLHFDEGRPMISRRRCCSLGGVHAEVFQNLNDACNQDKWTHREDGLNVLALMHAARSEHFRETGDGRSRACKPCRMDLGRELMTLYRHWWEDVARIVGMSGWEGLRLQEDVIDDWNGEPAERGWWAALASAPECFIQ